MWNNWGKDCIMTHHIHNEWSVAASHEERLTILLSMFQNGSGVEDWSTHNLLRRKSYESLFGKRNFQCSLFFFQNTYFLFYNVQSNSLGFCSLSSRQVTVLSGNSFETILELHSCDIFMLKPLNNPMGMHWLLAATSPLKHGWRPWKYQKCNIELMWI